MSKDAAAIDALVAHLKQRGHIAPEVPPMPVPAVARPWYISIVLGGAGWFAGLFGLTMLGLLFRPDTAGAFFALGLGLLGGAWLLYHADREQGFVEQLALAMSIAGQLGVGIGIGIGLKAAAATAFLVVLLECGLALLLPNRLSRTLCTFFACAAWAVAIRFALWGEPSWRHGGETEHLGPALVGWFTVWVPVAALAFYFVRSEIRILANRQATVLRPIQSGLLLALAFCTAASEPFSSFVFERESTGFTNFLALWPFLSLIACLFALYLAFQLRSRALIGTSIAGALLHIGHFYYALGVSLIAKSIIMILIGAALLFVARTLSPKEASS